MNRLIMALSIAVAIAILPAVASAAQPQPMGYRTGVGHYNPGAQQNNGTTGFGPVNGQHTDIFGTTTFLLFDPTSGEYIRRYNGMTLGERVYDLVDPGPPPIYNFTDYDNQGQQTGTGHIVGL